MQTETQTQTIKQRNRTRENIDFDELPPEALLKISDVILVTSLSRSVLERRYAEGTFPRPTHLGRNRVWTWGAVRKWLREVAKRGAN